MVKIEKAIVINELRLMREKMQSKRDKAIQMSCQQKSNSQSQYLL